MPTLTYSLNVSGGGVQLSSAVSRTADGLGSREVPLPVGAAGTLTTRTDADTGEITASDAGHGIESGDVVDIYWDGGVQYGVTVGTVDGTAIPIDSGSGDDLPAATTAVVVTKQVEIAACIDGDELALIAVQAFRLSSTSTAPAHVDFQDSGGATIEELDLVGGIPDFYDAQGGAANPYTGNPIEKIMASNGSATEECTLKVLWLVDSTP